MDENVDMTHRQGGRRESKEQPAYILYVCKAYMTRGGDRVRLLLPIVLPITAPVYDQRTRLGK